MNRNFTICVYLNSLLVIALTLYLFIAPVIILAQDLGEPALSGAEVPRFAFRWHRTLSANIERWARQRVESGQASRLSLQDISGTEWPIFSAVFYLWATESLQIAWERDSSLSSAMPKEYARGAIEATAALVSDPHHADWVKKYWGDDYLNHENIFYRMLLISGLTSYQKLLGNDQYQQLLADQVESLSSELDASPYGLLDDYPGQCFPIDILPAIAAIRRADSVLGTDHSAFTTRALRGFEGARLDQVTGLPAYIADAKSGLGVGPARGVGISYMLIWAPELWPETASRWYDSYEKHFWQQSWASVGVREFSRSAAVPFSEWNFSDVDAGPVAGGYGTAASAFGIGAARVHGRFDQAYPLSAEALVASWPLPDGTLFVPRLLSNLSDAPYVGEVILLFALIRRPITDQRIVMGERKIPPVVYLALLCYLGIGSLLVGTAIASIRRWKDRLSKGFISGLQRLLLIRLSLCVFGFALATLYNPLAGLLPLLLAQLILGTQSSPAIECERR